MDDHRRRFETIYAENFGPVLGYALRRTENADDAADVVAETFLTAWRRLADVPPGDGSRLWLYGVARRVLANHHRGERRRSDLGDRLKRDLRTVQPNPVHTGQTAAVAAAFRSLPPADRELLALVAWEDLDRAQIAAVLGCSRNAVRIRLHRARAKFGQAMAEQANRPQSPLLQVMNGDSA
ncbi:MAG: RNA polymerase sigma factor [Streptosporangiaceae bacterium]